ncbi:hypothetical protein SAMN05216258_10632 [Albimonas pacifica]|uniref:Uncharacterized protein n=1 Tax=Albimonas pacifica TaxID=1114924 RepID=A0A1I3HJP2_9RHOB|nr:hypothetical protein SAMN05216258_10632 [Albimonas pacifica]
MTQARADLKGSPTLRAGNSSSLGPDGRLREFPHAYLGRRNRAAKPVTSVPPSQIAYATGAPMPTPSANANPKVMSSGVGALPANWTSLTTTAREMACHATKGAAAKAISRLTPGAGSPQCGQRVARAPMVPSHALHGITLKVVPPSEIVAPAGDISCACCAAFFAVDRRRFRSTSPSGGIGAYRLLQRIREVLQVLLEGAHGESSGPFLFGVAGSSSFEKHRRTTNRSQHLPLKRRILATQQVRAKGDEGDLKRHHPPLHLGQFVRRDVRHFASPSEIRPHGGPRVIIGRVLSVFFALRLHPFGRLISAARRVSPQRNKRGEV